MSPISCHYFLRHYTFMRHDATFRCWLLLLCYYHYYSCRRYIATFHYYFCLFIIITLTYAYAMLFICAWHISLYYISATFTVTYLFSIDYCCFMLYYYYLVSYFFSYAAIEGHIIDILYRLPWDIIFLCFFIHCLCRCYRHTFPILLHHASFSFMPPSFHAILLFSSHADIWYAYVVLIRANICDKMRAIFSPLPLSSSLRHIDCLTFRYATLTLIIVAFSFAAISFIFHYYYSFHAIIAIDYCCFITIVILLFMIHIFHAIYRAKRYITRCYFAEPRKMMIREILLFSSSHYFSIAILFATIITIHFILPFSFTFFIFPSFHSHIFLIHMLHYYLRWFFFFFIVILPLFFFHYAFFTIFISHYFVVDFILAYYFHYICFPSYTLHTPLASIYYYHY